MLSIFVWLLPFSRDKEGPGWLNELGRWI